MGGSWEGGTGEGRKETEKRKEEGGRRRGGEKEGETETEGGWTISTLGRVKGTHMNVEL